MKLPLVAAVAVAFLALMVPSPAGAKVRPINEGGDTSPCVTYEEFDAFHIGMREHRVQRVFDNPGRRVPRSAMESELDAYLGIEIGKHSMVRSYPGCPDASDPDGSPVLVEFSLRQPWHRALGAVAGID